MDALFSPKGGQGLKSMDKENAIQGLYHDLLACLAGGDNPRLPPGFKQKPMTGFCEILDAFNETIKIREAGSGIVCELSDSSDRKNPSHTTSGENVKCLNKDSGQSLKTESIKSYCSGNELSTSETDRSPSNSSIPNEKPTYLELFRKTSQKLLSEETVLEHQPPQKLQDQNNGNIQPEENETYEDAFDFDGPNPILSMLKVDFIEGIGPPMTLSKSQAEMARPQTDKSEVDQYSDELKKLGKIVNANITLPNRTEFPRGGMNLGALIGDGIIPSFPDPLLMNPSAALERMYSVESCMSSYLHQKSKPASTYQSCIAIATSQPKGPNAISRGKHVTLKSSTSIYEDCLNVNERTSDADFLAALEAKLREEEDAAGREHGYNNNIPSKMGDGNKPLNSNAYKFRKPAGMNLLDQVNHNEKSTSYHSVHEESDDDKYQIYRAGSSDKQRKQKSRSSMRLQRTKTSQVASSSDSEYGDAH